MLAYPSYMCIILYFVLCKVPSWHCAYFDFKHTYYTNDRPWSYHPKKHKSSSLVQAARHCQQSPSHLVSLQDPNLVQSIRMKLQAQGRLNCVQGVQVFICWSVLVWHIVACKTRGLAAGVAMGKGVLLNIPDWNNQGAVEAEPPRWQWVIAQLTETDQALAAHRYKTPRLNPGSFFKQLGSDKMTRT